MRKSAKLAAGLGVVAGLGITFLPLSASATVSRTDTLNVTVTEACTISGVELDDDLELENIYDATVDPGTDGVAFVRRTEGTGGSATENTFTVVCNYADGYKIVANAENEGKLMGQDAANSEEYIPAADPAANTSYWAAIVSTTGNLESDVTSLQGIGTANMKIAHNDGASDANGDSFTVEYEVGAAINQEAGLYSGSVAYTLVRGAI
jgi:hypothetical protein